ERLSGDEHAADMDAEMARRALDALQDVGELAPRQIGNITDGSCRRGDPSPSSPRAPHGFRTLLTAKPWGPSRGPAGPAPRYVTRPCCSAPRGVTRSCKNILDVRRIPAVGVLGELT